MTLLPIASKDFIVIRNRGLHWRSRRTNSPPSRVTVLHKKGYSRKHSPARTRGTPTITAGQSSLGRSQVIFMVATMMLNAVCLLISRRFRGRMEPTIALEHEEECCKRCRRVLPEDPQITVVSSVLEVRDTRMNHAIQYTSLRYHHWSSSEIGHSGTPAFETIPRSSQD